MTLHMDYETVQGSGTYATVSLQGAAVGGFVLTNDYSGPRTLRFRIHQASHTLPLGMRKFVRFWDDTYFSSSEPLFEGYVWDVQPDPSDANLIHYLCYDPTHMVGREVPVMSLPWEPGPPIAYSASAVPRLVLNAYQDADDDYAIQRDIDVSVGGAIGGILDDALPILRYWNAAPALSDAYVVGGDLSDMTYQPQQKLVMENQKITDAIRQLLTHYPARRLLFMPGTRKWLFIDLNAATANTVTLNKSTGTDIVIGCDLRRSLDKTCTAVRIFGPETIQTTVYSTQDASLDTTAAISAGTYSDGFGMHSLSIPYTWQIAADSLRKGGRRLEADCYAPMGAYNYVRTRSPNLQLSWDGGTTWITILNPLIDFANGIISSGVPIFYYVDPPPYLPYSDQQIFPPNAARVVWAAFAPPLSVRRPSTGFEGSAYTEFGVQNEEMIYDPTLAAGYEWGTPVITATREAQFEAMAQAILDQRKETIYTGVIVLRGLHYDYSALNRRINIAAKDADGAALTTGWEDINAQVTGVEYDFEEQITTLTINGDQLELLGEDPDELKRKLGIHQLTQGWEVDMQLVYSFMNLTYSPVEGVNVVSGVRYKSHFTYSDSETGERQQ